MALIQSRRVLAATYEAFLSKPRESNGYSAFPKYPSGTGIPFSRKNVS